MAILVKVVLLKDEAGLGKKGDTVKVKAGFAYHWLFPKGAALPADNRTALELQEKVGQKKKAGLTAIKEAATLKRQLEKLTLTVERPVNKQGKLYASLTAKEIATLLGDQGYGFAEKDVLLDKPIKKIGQYRVTVNLANGAKVGFHLEVVSK